MEEIEEKKTQQNVQSPAPTAEQPVATVSTHKQRLIPFIIGIFILFLVPVFLLLQKDRNFSSPSGTQAKSVETTPTLTPTPMPFAEMTIPYLRKQEYTSSLGELKSYAQGESYTSYLTSYASEDLKINGLLTKPSGEMPEGGWPAIVFVHGYIPPNQYATTEKYVDYIDYLARNGFVVFKIDLRGHGESEGEAGGGYYGSDYIVDALNARAALQASDFVNPKKIGMWGHSMAGNVLMRSLAAQPDIPAISIWAGAVYTYTDQQKYGIQDSSYQPQPSDSERQRKRRLLFEKYGQPSDTSPFWSQVAPTNFLGDIKGAIQLNHAVDDDVVNIGYSEDLNIMLEKTTIPHEFHEYPSGGHNINGGSFVAAMENTVAFFKKYLE